MLLNGKPEDLDLLAAQLTEMAGAKGSNGSPPPPAPPPRESSISKASSSGLAF